MNKTPKNNRNIILSIFLLLGVAFSVVTIVFATAPDPGHNFTESSGGVAQGDLLYGSAVDVLSALTKNSTASRYLSNSGASNNPAWAQVDLTNGVTGALPDGNISSAATWNAKMTNPMTTLGDIIYGGASGVATRLGGSAGFLKSTGAAAPAWSAVSLTADVSGILPTANGGTGIAYFTAAGPTVARTYTFPDANATVLTGNTAVTVAQGGTGLTSITANNLIYGNGTGNALLLAPGGTTGAVLMNTAAGAPSWSLLSALPSTAGALPVVNGGTGLTAAASDAVLVGDSTTAYTARTLPASCAVTTAKLLYDSTTNLFSCGTDQTGAAGTATQYNQSVTTPAAGFAADTYLVGSSIAIPASSLKIGSRYHLIFNVSKTAAGLATPILNVRFGTLGTTGDAIKCAITFSAQTAAIDTGTFEVWATFRTVGSGTTAVLQCVGQRRHGLSVTGLGTLVSSAIAVTSAGFDSTVASSIVGTSINGGLNALWTITLVQAELSNLQ